MTPRTARARRGQRAVGFAPRNHGRNVTVVATLGPTGIGPTVALVGSATGDALAAYARQLLVPSLRPGQVVVLDNLSAHKNAEFRAAVEAAGCRLCFLPPYSPDFNPIELAFAKIKPRLRRAAARSPDDLLAALAEAIDAVTPLDTVGYFAHCGSPLPTNHGKI